MSADLNGMTRKDPIDLIQEAQSRYMQAKETWAIADHSDPLVESVLWLRRESARLSLEILIRDFRCGKGTEA